MSNSYRHGEPIILPMVSGVNILPNTSVQVTSRPQRVAFHPERMIIGGTPGDWIVQNILIGRHSCLRRSMPGDAFAEIATSLPYVDFTICGVGVNFSMVVDYVGQRGAPFICGVLGSVVIHGKPVIFPGSSYRMPSTPKKKGRPPAPPSPSIGRDPYGDD